MRVTKRTLFLLAIMILFGGAQVSADPTAPPKNIILIIGDGLGPQQIALAKLFAQYTSHVEMKKSSLESFLSESEIGLMQSVPHGALVNDSACAITQISSGVDALSEALGFDDRGKKVTTILELARTYRKVAGLVSDTRITHATPAGFVAKVMHRTDENEIAEQLIKNGPEVMFSGGVRHFIPKSAPFQGAFHAESKREDEKDLLRLAKERGYQLAFDRTMLRGLKNGKSIGLFAESGMQNGIMENNQLREASGEPTLAEMSGQAIKMLSTAKQGFFLMIEAGQIDWAGHQNDAGTLLHELLRLERALKVVVEFAKQRDDTIVVLASDHETGGFGFSYSGANIPQPSPFPGATEGSVYAPQYNFGDPLVLDKLFAQKRSFYDLIETFSMRPKEERTAKALTEFLQENISFKVTLNDADSILDHEKNDYYRPGHETLSSKEWPKISDFSAFYPESKSRAAAVLARAISEEQGIVWASGTHTSSPVVVAAYGPKQWSARFNGYYSAVELGKRLKSLIGPP